MGEKRPYVEVSEIVHTALLTAFQKLLLWLSPLEVSVERLPFVAQPTASEHSVTVCRANASRFLRAVYAATQSSAGGRTATFPKFDGCSGRAGQFCCAACGIRRMPCRRPGGPFHGGSRREGQAKSGLHEDAGTARPRSPPRSLGTSTSLPGLPRANWTPRGEPDTSVAGGSP